MDRIKTQVERKNRQLSLFPEPQGGSARDRMSLDRRERVAKAVRDYFRRSGK